MREEFELDEVSEYCIYEVVRILNRRANSSDVKRWFRELHPRLTHTPIGLIYNGQCMAVLHEVVRSYGIGIDRERLP